MNLEDIQELIKFVAKSGATEVDLEIDNIKISIKSPAKKRRGKADVSEVIHQIPTQIINPSPVPIPATPTIVQTTSTEVDSISKEKNTSANEANDEEIYITIKLYKKIIYPALIGMLRGSVLRKI